MESLDKQVYDFLVLFEKSCEDINGYHATDIFVFMNNNNSIREMLQTPEFRKLLSYIDEQGYIAKCDIGITHYEITQKGYDFIKNYNTNSN